jgi:multidrug transporter EmrE-like cation transporter
MNNNLQSTAMPLALSRSTLGHIFLGGCLFFGSAAQLMLKYATLLMSDQPNAWVSFTWILCGLGIYAIGTCFWAVSLGYLDLSYAYPFTGLTYVLVLGTSWLLFNESMSWERVVGVLFICAGVGLIPARTRRGL